ncbi:restriction endonuclease subunit S [Gemmobacter nectariphilus]|uniref:restriction endonuclease subunit S n=1 Tax=Gemmobacter nectariphilus TaxID=220343 RepID=UPI0004892492|nr:restriction endonuclease subunit S [Gemmobacter nectariphilus]
MMRRYPAYRDSGVDWLGEVPDGWEVRPFRQLISRIESGTSVNAVDAPALDGEIAVLKTSCVYAGAFDPNENKVVVPDEIDRVACPLRPDSLIVSRMNTPDLVGAAGHVTEALPNIFLPDRLWQITFKGLMTRFAYFFTLSPLYRDQVRIACAGTSSSMQNLAQDDFKSFLTPLPPLTEQTAIAAFLDRETGKIDALVAEQRRLIELLREKRQATISHAVTRGLNPAAPLKPSGVDWLGDVPEGWAVVRLRNVIKAIESGTSVNAIDVPASESELGVLKTSAVYTGRFDPRENKAIVPAEYDRVTCPVAQGALIVSRMNTPDLVGAAGYVVEAPHNIYLPDRLWQVSFHNANAQFVHLWTQSNFYRDQVRMACAGTSSSMQNLAQDDFKSFVFALPPMNEQDAIIAATHSFDSQFDSLITTAESAISLLLERRAALISAAVTGKIDVREAEAA